MNVLPSSKLSSWLDRERDSLRMSETVSIDLSREKSFTYRDSVAIANVINSTCTRVKTVWLKLGTSKLTTNVDYLLASYLIEAIKVEVDFEVELSLSLNDPQDDAVTFLRSSAESISSLTIGRCGGSGAGQGKPRVSTGMAKAIACLSKLRELTIGKECGDLDNQSQQAILLECVHQNKIRPEALTIDGKGFAGVGLFLRSQCASSLKKFNLCTSRLSHMDAIELKEGLLHNASIKHLILNCWHKEDDLQGLPILYECLEEERTLHRLQVNDCGYGYSNFFRPVLSALRNKTSLTHLEIDDFYDDKAGPLMREFLSANQWLQCLTLQVSSTDFLTEDFCKNMAVGLDKNLGLTCLTLKEDKFSSETPNLVLDLSPIVSALPSQDSLRPNQLSELSLSFGSCQVALPTFSALAHCLQQDQCPLKSLSVCFGSAGVDAVNALVQSAQKSPRLEKVDLTFPNRPHNVNPEQYFGVCADALSEGGSPKLSHFTLVLDDLKYDDLGSETKRDIMKRTLKCMEANTQLESAMIYPLHTDKEFKGKFSAYCARNKASKAAASLEELTLDPSDLPGILNDIEYKCQEFGVSTELYFVRIWFSLLMSRPEEVEKYCPSLVLQD